MKGNFYFPTRIKLNLHYLNDTSTIVIIQIWSKKLTVNFNQI